MLLFHIVPQLGERVNLRLEAGSTVSNQYVLTSFSGFKYEPANLPANQRVAWFATMTNDLEVSVLYQCNYVKHTQVVSERQSWNASYTTFT